MRPVQYPLIAFWIGTAVKAILIGFFRIVPSPELLRLLTDFDPGAFAFANWGSSLFFDPRRIAPGPGEALIFEILLAIGFGVECLMIGLLVQWLMHRAGTDRQSAASKDAGESQEAESSR